MPTILFNSGCASGIGHIFPVEQTVEALHSLVYKANWFAVGNPEILHHPESYQTVILLKPFSNHEVNLCLK